MRWLRRNRLRCKIKLYPFLSPSFFLFFPFRVGILCWENRYTRQEKIRFSAAARFIQSLFVYVAESTPRLLLYPSPGDSKRTRVYTRCNYRENLPRGTHIHYATGISFVMFSVYSVSAVHKIEWLAVSDKEIVIQWSL